MSVPPIPPEPPDRRRSDRIEATVIAVLVIIGATLLAMTDRIAPEAAIGAYAMAAAIAGFPVVVKRGNGDSK